MHLAPPVPLITIAAQVREALDLTRRRSALRMLRYSGQESGILGPKNESGEPLTAPRLRYSSLMPWQRPRGVANGAHRKSGVIYRLTSACPAES
jgi:hypothetical protein